MGEREKLLKLALGAKPTPGAILVGPPGVGKTYFAQEAASALKAPLVVQQMTPGAREEELILKLLPAPDGKVVAHEGALLEAARLSHKGRVVLLLDEWDKTRPSADAFLLDFLQEGRIRWGVREVAELSNLVVFLTSNGERELSEPLLRRLPVIEMRPHTPGGVARLLEESHPNHPFLGPAVRLYEAGLLAWERGWSPRPVTLQELRQLLDAVALDPEADWGEMIDVFVAKTPREREALRAALAELRGKEYAPKTQQATNYPLEALEPPKTAEKEKKEEKEPSPHIPRPWRPELPPIDAQGDDLDLDEALGVVVDGSAERLFTVFAKKVIEEAEAPQDLRPPKEALLGEWGGRPTTLLKTPLPVEALKDDSLWEGKGEVLVRAEGLPWKKALRLLSTVRYLSPKEVVGRTKEGGFEARVVIEADSAATLEVVVPVGKSSGDRYNLADAIRKAMVPEPKEEEKDPRYWGYEGPIPLGSSLSAFLKLERTLEAPDKGDKRGIVVRFLLPADGGEYGGRLVDEIRFEHRLVVMNSPLYGSWGDSPAPVGLRGWWREKREVIWAQGKESWRKLEAKAREYVLAEIAKLQEALARREALLKDDENEEVEA